MALGSIKVSGNVLQPGEYRIISGDSIFDILARTGGLTENAYLQGLIFTRLEEKKREKRSIDRLRRELDKSIAIALESTKSSNTSIGSIQALRELSISSSDFQAIGRVTGDFTKIETLKETKVSSGDTIFIPSRPTSVTVVGEVMSPGSILWQRNFNVNSYISSAAGFTQLAEKKRIFVISPNGQAKLKSNLWGSNNDVLPGSIVVVPRKIELASNLERISAVTEVVYQLTLTLAGIEGLLSN